MLKVFFVLLFLLANRSSWAETPLIDHIQKIKSSIVEVQTVYTKPMRKGGVASFKRAGAGLIIDPSGLIVTNTHIIANAPSISITLKNGVKCKGRVVFNDPTYDFSFLKISPTLPLRPFAWADSSKAHIGQDVIAIKNNNNILSGQIGNLIQSRLAKNSDLLEINIHLHKGDSGSPILDRQGKLLGLVMANKKSRDRSSIAIASNKIREQYLRYKQKI